MMIFQYHFAIITLLVCLIQTGTYTYFGYHVVRRGVIFVDLSLATGLSFFDIDAILAYFGKKGFVNFRQLAREEIKKKYGEDGFAIYKRFGREGLLLYEMIGKEASLKDIIIKSRVDPERAIDIFMFIHKVLGLDVPLDRDLIYRQIGLKK